MGMNKSQLIADYVNYYVMTTGKPALSFFESDDWLAQHSIETLRKMGIEESYLTSHHEMLKRGIYSAICERMSASEALCSRMWEKTAAILGEKAQEAVVWDANCGDGSYTVGVDNRNRLYLSSADEPSCNANGAVVFQKDFLNDIDFVGNEYFSDNLPQGLKDALHQNKPLIFMAEPPVVVDGLNDVKDMVRREYTKIETENGVLQYFMRMCNLIEFHGLTNAYIVMTQAIERNGWLQSLLYDFKPLGGICYEFNRVNHRYRAAIIWQYAPIDIDTPDGAEEYRRRYTVVLDKFSVDRDGAITPETPFTFEIKVAERVYSKGATVAYQSQDNCFTNYETDNSDPITALNIHNILPLCVLKHLQAGGRAAATAMIDTTALSDQWYTDCIPLFLFSKYNNFTCTDKRRNAFFPLNPNKMGVFIQDEKVKSTLQTHPMQGNHVGLELVANNYANFSSPAKSFLDYCVRLYVESYKAGVRSEADYPEGTVYWDAGLSQIRTLPKFWTVDVENRYNELQEDLVNFLEQSVVLVNDKGE